MEHPGISAGKVLQICAFDLREHVPGNHVRAVALCVFPKHASSEGPVPHPGLLCVLELAVWASAKRRAGGIGRRKGSAPATTCGVRAGVELGIRHRFAPNSS